MNDEPSFNRLETLKVIIEERRISLEKWPAGWQTKVYGSPQEIPNELPAAFASDDGSSALALGALVRQCYESGVTEQQFERPYVRGRGRAKSTILRSVRVAISYKK